MTTPSTAQIDQQAAEAVATHHAQMSQTLAHKVDEVVDAVRHDGDVHAARDRLVHWARHELLPHALAEETTLYAEAGRLAEGRLLVEALLAEHVTITGVVDDLAVDTDPITLAVTAGVLRDGFAMHRAKEEDQVVPLLLAAPGVSVAGLLGGMHEIIGGHEHHPGHEHDPGHGHGHGHG